MYRDNKEEQELVNELHDVLEQAKQAEMQFEEYCKVMKELMLMGSTNN